MHFRQYRERGYTMIEVMISMAILSVGVLGLVGMQVLAIRANRQGGRMSQAVFLAESQAEKLMAYGFNDSNLADTNTGNDPTVGAPFALPANNVIDATTFADSPPATTFNERGTPCGSDPNASVCPTQTTTFATALYGFQMFWQITNEDVNNSVPGPDLKRINVVVRFRDSDVGFGFRSVQVTVSKAWDL